jgi:branched-chain amino acid transport system substrate-binding protein
VNRIEHGGRVPQRAGATGARGVPDRQPKLKETAMDNRQILATACALAISMAGGGAAAQSETIRIGVVTPLTGTYAGIGQQVKWGLDLAAKEINDAGGIMGRKLELLYEDEEANPAVATQKAEKLFQVSNVDFLTGTVNSGSTLAVGQVAERNSKLIATTVSFSDAITSDKCSPNVFRVNARAGMQSAALAEWVAKAQPKANVFYLGPDYEMGRSTVAAFKSAAESRGAKTVGEVFAPLDNKDYSPFFGQIRSARPNVLYTSVAGNDTVRFFNQMSEYGVNRNVQIVGASGTVTSQNIAAIGKAAEGYVTGVGYSPEIDSPENKKFAAAFRTAWKADPDLYGADSYGLLYFYKAAVEKAKTTATDKVRTAMRDLEWNTPQGKKKMRAGDHQAIQDMYAVQVTGGKFRIVSRIDGNAAVGADTCTRF